MSSKFSCRHELLFQANLRHVNDVNHPRAGLVHLFSHRVESNPIFDNLVKDKGTKSVLELFLKTGGVLRGNELTTQAFHFQTDCQKVQ